MESSAVRVGNVWLDVFGCDFQLCLMNGLMGGVGSSPITQSLDSNDRVIGSNMRI